MSTRTKTRPIPSTEGGLRVGGGGIFSCLPAGHRWPCTQCGGDAFIGYSAGGKPGQDWDGRVGPDERLCTRCFIGRGGRSFFG